MDRHARRSGGGAPATSMVVVIACLAIYLAAVWLVAS